MLDAFLLLPLWYHYSLVGVLGLVIGSFLNVWLYRFHTNKSVMGSSHCLSCGRLLQWYELLPVISYLALQGRCRGCTSYIPFRYMLVELATASLFLASFYIYGPSLIFLVSLLVVSICVMMLVYDLYHLIIPNELVIALTIIAPVFIYLQTDTALTLSDWVNHVVSGVIASSFYGLLWFVSKGRWLGFGDVKLAFPLGAMVGLVGVFSLLVLSFWIGAALSLVYLGLLWVWRRGQTGLPFRVVPITIKSAVPFAPFLLLAFFFVLWLEIDVLRWFMFTW